VIASLCAIICFALFYFAFTLGIETRVTYGWNRALDFGFDFVLLVAALSASWAALNFSTRFVLMRRFPQLKLALQQKIGKTGYSMLSGIVLAFIICILMSSVKPLWLTGFIR
jgi:hypothetical protein